MSFFFCLIVYADNELVCILENIWFEEVTKCLRIYASVRNIFFSPRTWDKDKKHVLQCFRRSTSHSLIRTYYESSISNICKKKKKIKCNWVTCLFLNYIGLFSMTLNLRKINFV